MTNSKKIIIPWCITLASISIIDLLYHLFAYGISLHDYLWIWKECAAAIRGYDVSEVARLQIAVPGVGTMTGTWSASAPWTKIMGNIIHPGFFPESLAIVYGVLFYLFVMLWTWIKLFPYISNNSMFEKKDNIILCSLFFIMPIFWSSAIECWNNGMILSYIAFLSVIYCEEGHEIFGGILLGLSSIKPQIAGLFFVAFFLKKKVKPIIIAVMEIFSSWGLIVCWQIFRFRKH